MADDAVPLVAPVGLDCEAELRADSVVGEAALEVDVPDSGAYTGLELVGWVSDVVQVVSELSEIAELLVVLNEAVEVAVALRVGMTE